MIKYAMSVYNTPLSFNRFEISIVRILAKKREAMRISSLVEGFPDYYLEEVLEAISSLNYQGYILFSDLNTHHPRAYLNADKREEVLKLIDPLPLLNSIHSHNNKSTERSVNTVIIRSIAVFSLIVLGFISTWGIGEFSGQDQAVNVLYDPSFSKSHNGVEKPVKYQWDFDREYYRDTNSSVSTLYSTPGHFSQLSYFCSDERNYSS
jgi:hypothetical protein